VCKYSKRRGKRRKLAQMCITIAANARPVDDGIHQMQHPSANQQNSLSPLISREGIQGFNLYQILYFVAINICCAVVA
jgi:hypothetical protein